MTMTPPSLLALAAALALAAPAFAQEAGDAPPPSADGAQKISVLVTFGDEPCPESTGDEIVVCAQKPESERYRVPRELREEALEKKANRGGAWGAAVEDYDQNVASVGRPNSCSPVGSYGATGCLARALRQWYAERREIERAAEDD